MIGFLMENVPAILACIIGATATAFSGFGTDCKMWAFTDMCVTVGTSKPVMVFIERIVVPIEPFVPYFTAAIGLLAFSTYTGICTQGVVLEFVYITITFGTRVPVIGVVPIKLIE